MNDHIYIIAGEMSGDLLGGRLIQAMRQLSAQALTFAGVGGSAMQAAGVPSLFPMRDLSVMGLAEVAERLAAEPGGKEYGVPSVKIRFFGNVRRYGMVSPTVFWPIPRVYSGLVRIDRYEAPSWAQDDTFRQQVFELIDIAFAQRRKTVRNAFLEWAGTGNESAQRLLAASIDPARRGETLTVADFIRLLQRSGTLETLPAAAQSAEVG